VREAIVEVTVAAPPETVWRALRDPVEIRRWFGWEYDGLAEEIDHIFVAGARADDSALTVEVDGGDRFQLEPADSGTLLRLARSAAKDGYDPIEEGWITFMQQLRFALERHPGEDRRTIHGSGRPEDESRLEGEVWFRSEHQLGVIVEDWNDGLLVVTDDSWTGSAYGLGERPFP
jgi:hypothetical protein